MTPTDSAPDGVEIRGYVPGAIGRVVQMHARYYSEAWGFGSFFEAKVAHELGEFVGRFDEGRDGLWTVCKDGRVEGSIVIDGEEAASEGAHLRWFIMSSSLRGRGWGDQLLGRAVSFCREAGYGSIYLWTFKGLEPARRLYERHGFVLAEQNEGKQWGTEVLEQRFALTF